MMLSEFIQRTGFEPTADEYAKIEDAYYDFDGDKNAFCQAFVRGNGEKRINQARAEQIARLQDQLVEMEKMFKADAMRQDKKIADLQAALDRELEWKPCDGGTNMSQDRYEKLLKSCAASGASSVMNEEEAKQLIFEAFGFAPAKVQIITIVHTYEVNRHHQMRKSAEYTRNPLYDATDWNYIRFDCCGWMYEMVNGELKSYCC